MRRTLFRSPKLWWWLASLALLPVAIVQGRRIHAALTVDGPVQTTGCEEESFYAVWRVKHDLPTYTDSSQPPYAGQYFNWLFYRSYGAAAQAQADAAIPKIGRICTLAGGLIAFLLAWRAFHLGSAGAASMSGVRCRWSFLGAFALLTTPLLGWWIVSVRPDVWALTAEIGSVVWFLTWYPRHRWRAVAGAIALAYAAWAFKQANLTAAITLVLFLACKRERGAAMAVAAMFAFAIATTLLVGGPIYRTALAEVATGSTFDRQLGWENLVGAILRGLPVMSLPVYAIGVWSHSRPYLGRFHSLPGPVLFAGLGLAVSAGLAMAGSFKIGASTNYYFTAAFFAALLGFAARPAIAATRVRWFGDGVVGLAVVAACGLAWLQLSGVRGSIDLDASRREFAQRLDWWRQLPTPRFSSDRRLALPWVDPGNPHFAPGYNYEIDRQRGREFEHGGIGGLIRKGYFASLMLPADAAVSGVYDGASLQPHYTHSATLGGMAIFVRRTAIR